MARCCQAICHYLSQYPPRSMSPEYGITRPQWVNSPPPSVAYVHQWTGSSLLQVMACRLFGAKPLPESMLAYCRLDSWKQISVKFESESYYFQSSICIWNCHLPKWRPFCPGGDELKSFQPVWLNGFLALFVSYTDWQRAQFVYHCHNHNSGSTLLHYTAVTQFTQWPQTKKATIIYWSISTKPGAHQIFIFYFPDFSMISPWYYRKFPWCVLYLSLKITLPTIHEPCIRR